MESQQPNSSPEVRLLPLAEGAPNEGLANLLARLLIEDESQAEQGAQAALLILTGIQSFIDTGGDYLTVERIWEPVIVARQLEKTHGDLAWKKAGEMAEAAKAANDLRGADIYERVSVALHAELNKRVDNKT